MQGRKSSDFEEHLHQQHKTVNLDTKIAVHHYNVAVVTTPFMCTKIKP